MKLKDIDNVVRAAKPKLMRGVTFGDDDTCLTTATGRTVNLNSTARWLLRQFDGKKKVEDVLLLAKSQYPDVSDEVVERDVFDFVYNLHQWGILDKLPGLGQPSGYYMPRIEFTDRQVDAARSGCGMCKETFL